MPHLVATISAHGFGHMAITAPILEELYRRRPECRVTISTGITGSVLRSRIHCPFQVARSDHDFGLRMNRDLSVNIEKTVTDYAALHDQWEVTVDSRAKWLSGAGCDLLLSNVSYLDAAAADRAGIPAIAVSPLNWADLYRYYAPQTPQNVAVFEQMVQAYNRAEVFLTPEPCMPMAHFANVQVIPPVAQLGNEKRRMIGDLFGLDAHTKLVLLALGGLEASLPIENLPVIEGVKWLAEERWRIRRDDVLCLNETGLTFPDLLASSDLLVGKPGYGAFAEAARLGKPVVYVRRPDWPEETFLIDWLKHHVPCREARQRHLAGVEAAIRELLDEPPSAGCSKDGTSICVEHLTRRLK